MSPTSTGSLTAESLSRDQRAERWQITDTVYIVDFWRKISAPPAADPEKMGHQQSSFRLSNARDVNEVLAWASDNAAGRSFVVYAWVTSGGEPGLIQLYGVDPTVPVPQ